MTEDFTRSAHVMCIVCEQMVASVDDDDWCEDCLAQEAEYGDGPFDGEGTYHGT